MAASDRGGVLPLFRGPDTNIAETSIFDGHRLEFECEVEAAPLSDILRPEEMRRARLIRIDVEGAEWRVVIGMGPLKSRIKNPSSATFAVVLAMSQARLTLEDLVGQGPENISL